MTNLVYVFDYRLAEGTFLPFRVPTFVARFLCNRRMFLDYAETPEGY